MPSLHEPGEVLTQAGGPFRVYSPYYRAWNSLEKDGPKGRPRKIQTPPNLRSEPCPSLKTWKLPAGDVDLLKPGERAARARLKEALDGPLANYSEKRNTPFGRTTSRLSQDLRFGLLSIREILPAYG